MVPILGKQSNTGHTLQKTLNPKSAEHTHTEEPSLTRHYYFLSNIAVKPHLAHSI